MQIFPSQETMQCSCQKSELSLTSPSSDLINGQDLLIILINIFGIYLHLPSPSQAGVRHHYLLPTTTSVTSSPASTFPEPTHSLHKVRAIFLRKNKPEHTSPFGGFPLALYKVPNP